jgi:hypothetical protein
VNGKEADVTEGNLIEYFAFNAFCLLRFLKVCLDQMRKFVIFHVFRSDRFQTGNICSRQSNERITNVQAIAEYCVILRTLRFGQINK